ncbi:uncharacterized protein LOC109790354 isoform X2 [Cajanus cajan]|uniref:uncharacterized protein LOC109790354 isoform X2 n=1 Tax=Cajanus cajan TaxID=3821 RepID=UPI0010FB9A69|nr:uncharacterized protein LOC109790354 isoform X2 [Cajanus cajan]
MSVYVVASLDLNWHLGLLGFGENKAEPISEDNNTKIWLQKFILWLPIVIFGIWWLLHQSEEERESNLNGNEVDHEGEVDQLDHFFKSHQGEQEHLSSELNYYFDGGDHLPAAAPSDSGGRRHGGCASCGNLSTTRCSRCKAARYCSMECQIIHWRSGHKYECSESKNIADEARPTTHDHGISKLVENSEKESASNGSNVDDGVKWSLESDVGVEVSSESDVNNIHGCEVCGRTSTTRCSRCKSVKYCSVKCLIMDWRWHKDQCIARDVDSTPIERAHRDVGLLKSSYEEEENIHSSSEGTSSFKSPIEASQDPINKVLYLEDEAARSRNEALLLQSELEDWKKRANFAKERWQSLKKESNHQLLKLKNERESISDAEKKACSVIRSLHERLKHLQKVVQESIVEKTNLEEHIQNLEHECAKLNKELQEEHKRSQFLTVEYDKSHEAAQIAKREVEAVRQVLQEERENAQRIMENFRRDVIFAESRAAFAEAKLSDLHRKIRISDYKVCSICLCNEKDLAFGCGHMTCRECGLKLSKCHICREQITNHIKLFPG